MKGCKISSRINISKLDFASRWLNNDKGTKCSNGESINKRFIRDLFIYIDIARVARHMIHVKLIG